MRSGKSPAAAILVLAFTASMAKGDPIGSMTQNSLGNLLYGGSAASTQVIQAPPSWLSNAFATTGATTTTTASMAPLIASPSTITASSAPTVDAFLNFGTGNYAEASNLTSGTAESWTQSPIVQKLFGGTPTAAQQTQFDATVMQRVQETYNLSGIPISLTTNPAASAAHSISVVSNAASSIDPGAIGMTDTGNNGFSFIDKFIYASSVDQLEWAVAHNIAHELMHAFGLGFHPDQTGTYLDAPTASWSLLTNPNTVFSPAAVQDLLGLNFLLPGGGLDSGNGLEKLNPGFEQLDALDVANPNVPEPTTIALWASAAGLAALARRRSRRILSTSTSKLA